MELYFIGNFIDRNKIKTTLFLRKSSLTLSNLSFKIKPNASDHHVWHYANYPTHLYTPGVANQKRDYIHQNPVRAGIVIDEASYLYSSACEESPLKVLDL